MNEENEPNQKLTFDILYERGYVATCCVGAGNRIYNKWGFELDIHCNFVYCKINIGQGEKYIYSLNELIDLEKQLNINQTPLITKMSVEELKSMIPEGYTYVLNKRKRKIESDTQMSFLTKKGRYKILKGDQLICEGYNDQEESYFLCTSLLYILKVEKLLPKNLN